MLALRAGAAVSTNSITLLLLLALAADASSPPARRCYICGPRDQGFKQTCDRFDSNPQEFAEGCENDYLGCSINVQGTQVIRQCEEYKLNDCKTLNDVTYCYCSTDLCNKLASPNILNNDDEDIMDGSGAEEVVKELPTTVPPASTASSITGKMAMLMVSLMIR